MPRRWFHELVDLCTLGKSYWPIHKWKDEPVKFLGPEHREVRHRETGEWLAGLFKKAGISLPSELWESLRNLKAGEVFNSPNLRRVLTKLPPEANASILHEEIDRIWSSGDYEDKKLWVEEALKTLFEGKPLWGNKDLCPPENEDLQKLREWVKHILEEKGINGFI